MANLIEIQNIAAEVLNQTVAALGSAPGSARIGVIVDFTGLNPDLSNLNQFVRAMETNRTWTPADGDMSRVARNPLTGEENFYKAGEKVKIVVLGAGENPIDYRSFFNTPNTKVAGVEFMKEGKTFSEFLKAVAGKKLKCTVIERHESDNVILKDGIRQVPSYTWEII